MGSPHCTVTEFAAKFWARVDRGDPSACWEWQGCRHRFGHGQTSVPAGVIEDRHRVHYSHRVAYHLTSGPIPDGLFVCHCCDNPACCNPAHLYAGSQARNMRDMSDRGRARSSGPPKAILTEDNVRDIRRRRSAGERCVDLAREYGVSYTCISLTSRGLKWRNVS